MIKLLLLIFLFQPSPTDELTTLLEQAKPSQPKMVRLDAMQKLQEAGKAEPERVRNTLEPLLQEKDAEIRRSALLAIGLSGIEQTPCPLVIVKALNDDDELTRSDAGAILSLYENFPKEAVPLLFATAESKDPWVRSAVAEALQAAAGNTPKVKKTLEKLITDSNLNVRHSAHQAYYHLTDDLNFYVGYLLQITADRADQPDPESEEEKNLRIAEENQAVLGAMIFYIWNREKSDELAPALIHHLKHKDTSIRQCALRQLRAMCISSKASFRAVAAQKPQQKLTEVAEKDENEEVRIWSEIVIDLLKKGPPQDAPEKLEPLETLDLESLKTGEE